ncbi:helix-turn-helix transcriptional regulator [Qipengyuania sp.]|uniref:helix-turn-helix transcriptional regulator n=1 Tax=Qipengyuania sp. TaxID=2004515 RepID=UPI0035C8415A
MSGGGEKKTKKRKGIGAPTPWDRALFIEFGSILKTQDIFELRRCMLKLARIYGFDALYAVSPLTRNPEFGRHLSCLNFPAVWERQWRRRLFWVDPLIDYCLKHPQVFMWSYVFDKPNLTPAQKRYVAFCRDLGMGEGLGTIVYGPGGRMGFTGFGKPTSRDCFSAQSFQAVATIAQLSFNRYCALSADADGSKPELSPREIEIMAWAARGKSNGDIATILGISRHTVDTHLRRAFRKLGTSDRTVACLKALELGYIQSSEQNFSPQFQIGKPTPPVED